MNPTVSTKRLAWPAIAVVVALALIAPLFVSDFFLNVILTKALWLGIAAASLIFLAAYGGMVSLAQVGIYGVAGHGLRQPRARRRRRGGGLEPVRSRWSPRWSSPRSSASASAGSRRAARGSTS